MARNGSGVTIGIGVGPGSGVGVTVGTGVAVGIGAAVGSGVGIGSGIGVGTGVGAWVVVGTGVEVLVAVGVGEGVARGKASITTAGAVASRSGVALGVGASVEQAVSKTTVNNRLTTLMISYSTMDSICGVLEQHHAGYLLCPQNPYWISKRERAGRYAPAPRHQPLPHSRTLRLSCIHEHYPQIKARR